MFNLFLINLIEFIYIYIVKSLLFLFDPELVHDRFIKFGKYLSKIKFARWILESLFCSTKNQILEQNIKNIVFSSPIGLAAGFDKNADLINIIPCLGFGHGEFGSVTKYAYEGNPKPRLKRFPQIKSIWVNYGLKNIGVDKIIKRFENIKYKNFVYGISIAKTNSPDTCDENNAIKDYIYSYKLANENPNIQYITINISCPNTFGGEPFTTHEKLDKLLFKVSTIFKKKLIFIKMPISISDLEFEQLLDVIIKYQIDGVIIGNLQKDKSFLQSITSDQVVISKGGLSGKPTFDRSNELISLTYKKYGDRLIIIGCGGVFSAEDAYEKVKRGASLIQMITGMIYNSPSIIAKINLKLKKLIQNDGYTSITEAIGAYHK